ncbi:hypothetical protein FKM82_023835 [Ascaphus truei]
MVMPNVMEMIAALGPSSSPFNTMQSAGSVGADYTSQGSGFQNPGGFSEGGFPSTNPSTPTMSEFTPAPPPISYQSDIPSSLLAPEKAAGPPLTGQVSDPGRGKGSG